MSDDLPPTAVYAAAHFYADHGLPVFPCRGKLPHTAHGFKDASTDGDQIDAWWRRWPDANVGAPTGILYDAVDIDGPVGFNSLATLEMAGIITRPDQLGRVLTPRGMHILVPVQPDLTNGASIVDGVDYRAKGGYTILPPSRSADGTGAYHWVYPPVFAGAQRPESHGESCLECGWPINSEQHRQDCDA